MTSNSRAENSDIRTQRFRNHIYLKCLAQLRSWWRGRPGELPNRTIAFSHLLDNQTAWWLKEVLPKPSKREAEIAVEVFSAQLESGSRASTASLADNLPGDETKHKREPDPGEAGDEERAA